MAALAMLLPLWHFALLPSADLPHHLGISSVIWRLLRGDTAIAAFYELNLQPLPYYLAYLLLVPAVGLLGPLAAAKAFYAAVALGFAATTTMALRAVAAPPCLVLGAVFLFFGPLFYWGFVVTLAGLPCVFLAVWAVIRLEQTGLRRYGLAAGAAGFLATCAHAILAWPVCLIAAGLAAAGCRRWGWAALGLAVAGLLPLSGVLLAQPGHGAFPEITPPNAVQQWHFFKGFLGPFDHGWGRAAHLLFWLTIAGAAWRSQGRRSPLQRRWGAVVLALALTFAFFPRWIISGEARAWGISFRYLSIAEFLLLLVWAPRAQRRRHANALAWGLCAATLVHGVAQWQFWRAFNETAAPVVARLDGLPREERLAVPQNGHPAFLHAWAPVTTHLSSYYLAGGGLCTSDVFAGGHLPIRERQPCAQWATPPRPHQAE